MTFIPPKTQEKLATAYGKGSRHAAMFEIAMPLLGNGLPASAVFATLREKFPDADKTDKEIQDVINWCIAKSPTPSGYGQPAKTEYNPFARPEIKAVEKPKRTPQEHAEWWLGGKTTTVEAFKEKSQLKITGNEKENLWTMLEMLYLGTEHLNIVCKFIETEGKARPLGGGKTMTRDEWLEYLRDEGVPQSNAGAWVRPNPCRQTGSGKDGAIMDSDITAFRFLLVESDVLKIEVQLALFAALKLPIAAVITSGGASAHAWVNIGASSAEDYTEKARRILTALSPFGIDQANKNPSRLSRLPAATRKIGAAGDGKQSLLWLNPGKSAVTNETLKAFEDSLQIASIEEKPFNKVVQDSIARYDDLYHNGSTGVPTGITDFDFDTGGLTNGHMIVIAAETNGGKSSLALNILNGALTRDHGAALFTLEMGNDEIADILFAINCRVNRNHFNTGKFTDDELKRMTDMAGRLSNLPLWSFDESMMTMEQIRSRVLALVSEDVISLAIIDYAQIIEPKDSTMSRELQVASVAREIRSLAKDAKIPIVVLSQLNDEGKLRESRVIAHEAHVVIVIENKEDEKQMIMKVVKGRRIQKKNYPLFYEPSYCLIQSQSQPASYP